MNLRSFVGGSLLSATFVLFSAHCAAAGTLTIIGKPAATAPLRLLLKLPLRNVTELEALTRVQSDPQSPQYHRFLTLDQFRLRYAPLASTVQRAISELRANGLRVTRIESQFLQVSATVAQTERAFGVRVNLTRDAANTVMLAADAAPALPSGLTALNASVVGLGGTLAPRAQSRRLTSIPQNRNSKSGAYWFDDLKQAYAYPTYAAFNGKGVTIATVGLSDFSDTDAALYFNHERLGGVNALAPAPLLEHFALGGTPFDPNSTNSGEANLDVQQSGGSAPGATIVGVAVPSQGEGFLYGYSAIVESNQYDIVSTSFGECELFYTAPYTGGIDQTHILKAYHDIFLQGNSQGITFVFSSGDSAGLPCPQPGYVSAPTGAVYRELPGVSIWSDDPNTTSVGGTNLVTSFEPGKLSSRYLRENAYHDTVLGPIDPYFTGNYVGNALWGSQGGASVLFAKPWYQKLVDTRSAMRTNPDVSMQMGGCPYEVNDSGQPVPVRCGSADSAVVGYVGGAAYGYIGTSASAPEFAGLLAVLEQSQGNVRLGNVNGYMYELAQTNTLAGGGTIFRQGIPGSNGVIQIERGQLGYNQILGLGTPIAKNFVLLPFAQRAADPQTPSNP